MIDGEGPREDRSGSVSPDPFDSFTPKSPGGGDVSPGSVSRSSSCGESEFERYCSANSVMGTPSFCGSFGPLNDSAESEFESLRSLDGGLENFSLGGRFDRNLEELKLPGSGFDHLKGSGSSQLQLYCVEGNCGINNELDSRLENANVRASEIDSIGDGVVDDLNIVADVGEGSSGVAISEGNDGRFCMLDSELGLEFDGREEEREEDETSSRYEHSEDDSMYGCGSDYGNRENLYTQRSIQYSKNGNFENENPLLINSSIAFGSGDWDDFEQETGGGSLASLTLDEYQEQEKQDLVTERKLFNSESKASMWVPAIGLSEIGKDVTTESIGIRQVEENELVEDFNTSSAVLIGSQKCELMQTEEVRDVPVSICKVQGTCELAKDDTSTSIATSQLPSFCKLEEEGVRDISDTCELVQSANETTNHFTSTSAGCIFEVKQDLFVEKNSRDLGANISDYSTERKRVCMNSEIFRVDDSKIFDNQETGNLKLKVGQLYSHPSEHFQNENTEYIEDHKLNSKPSLLETNRGETMNNTSLDPFEDDPVTLKVSLHWQLNGHILVYGLASLLDL